MHWRLRSHKWKRKAVFLNRWIDCSGRKKTPQKTDETSGAQTCRSKNRGNIFQGKLSLGSSIQIKLWNYSLNTTSCWQIQVFHLCSHFVPEPSNASTEQVFGRQHLHLLRWVSVQQFSIFLHYALFLFCWAFSYLATHPPYSRAQHTTDLHSTITYIGSFTYSSDSYLHKGVFTKFG